MKKDYQGTLCSRKGQMGSRRCRFDPKEHLGTLGHTTDDCSSGVLVVHGRLRPAMLLSTSYNTQHIAPSRIFGLQMSTVLRQRNPYIRVSYTSYDLKIHVTKLIYFLPCRFL